MSDPSTLAAAIDPELAPGESVGEYVVDGKLGQGAFGQVFRAAHPVIGKQVAIKVLARRFSVDPEMVERFVSEARAVNQIRHRNIIDIFSFGQLPDGRHYYVMELLEGEPLDAMLERRRLLTLGEALPILRGIARALDAAHAKGIAHRDLKAENVFIATDADGSVFPKLLDFGIAKLMAPDDGLRHKTRTGTPVGTAYYMSPEQCRGRDVDHRTDIYAFGVLTYLMVTGKYPHDGEDFMTILMRQMTVEPELPSHLISELPAGTDEAILAMLRKDPIDRPLNLREALHALELAAEAAGIVRPTSSQMPSQPIAATGSREWATAPTVHPPTAPSGVAVAANTKTQTVAPLGRRRWLAGAVAVAAVALAAVIVVVAPWRTGDTDRVAPIAPVSPTAPPSPPTAPVPPPPSKPPVIAPKADPVTVTVTIDGIPEGTEVFCDGMLVGAGPGPVHLPRDGRSTRLLFKADGYVTTSRTVVTDRDQRLTVTLTRPARPRPPPRPTRDDLDDPFAKKKNP